MAGALECIGPKGLDIMIENGWTILDSLFYAMRYQPVYPSQLSPEEVERLERIRAGATRVVLPILGMAKAIASRLPPDMIMKKLDGDWLMRRANERFPILAERIRMHGEKGRKWLQKQARELALFLTGQLAWDDRKRRLVEVRRGRVAREK